MIPGIIIGVFILLIVLMYNSIIKKKNQVANAFGGMDVQLKKRYDLLPNLVASVQEYMKHEKELLTKVTELRSAAMQPNITTKEKMQINNELDGALKSLNVAIENYPEIKSNGNIMHLQQTLLTVEEQIAASRRFYNSAVTEYNNAIMVFPGSLISSIFNFKKEEVFEAREEERQNVDVKDLFNQ
ncbi:MAG: LemA family protein [Eubacteriales bacterium]